MQCGTIELPQMFRNSPSMTLVTLVYVGSPSMILVCVVKEGSPWTTTLVMVGSD